MVTTYVDHFMYTKSPAGLEYASLLGNSMRINGAVIVGAVNMPVTPALTVTLNQYDRVTIFDGLSSEVVTVGSAGANIGATNIPISALAFAHTQGTPCCSDGVVGSLADQIVNASAWVENITKQPLWSTTQTETLRIPTLRASFDNQNILTFRTKQYPITAINTLSLGTTQSNFVSYDQTQCFIDSNELVTVPVLQATGSGTSTWPLLPSQVNRQSNAYLNVNYTAGYTASTMPGDVRDACILLVSNLLSRRQNSSGADSIRLGDKQLQATQRGDNSGEGLHVKNARNILSQYTLRMF